MIRLAHALWRSNRASAAVEMVLVLPILLLLLFGSVEIGNYFMSEHAVQKGVRDAARYAARLPLDEVTDGTCNLGEAEVQDQIRRVARTGDPDADGSDPRLGMWDSDDTVTLNLACPTGAYAETGVYTDFPFGAVNITVAAAVPYQPLFDFLPFLDDDGLLLNAQSQSAVFGA